LKDLDRNKLSISGAGMLFRSNEMPATMREALTKASSAIRYTLFAISGGIFFGIANNE
jgi:hypothetical protein